MENIPNRSTDSHDAGGIGNGQGSNGGQTPNEQNVFMHTLEHQGVTCDICNCTVRGFRYKCLQCPDFDLCAACERKGNHPGHVMMRIAFPEQAVDAINRYFNAPGPSFPFENGALNGLPPWVFRRAVRRRLNNGACGNRESEGDSGDDLNIPSSACPYGLGKRGMKKWTKCMKKMAHQHKKSAEAYAKAFTDTTRQFGNSGPNENGEGQASPFDFGVAASQIQEFLNAVGIPIDVVELYDSCGNRGQPGSNSNNEPKNEEKGSQTSGNSTENATTQSTETSNVNDNNEGGERPTLATNMEQLRINSPNNGDQVNNSTRPMDGEVIMDVDTDSPGWTLLDNERNGDLTNTSSVDVTHPNPNPNPTASAPNEPLNGNTPTAPQGATGLYPPISSPQIQQILSGVSQAVNSMVRNIPIVTNPSGPPSMATSGPSSIPELDAQSIKTLNQLLSMGFSNHDGWLSRLVHAKRGNLDAVLNALFPPPGE